MTAPAFTPHDGKGFPWCDDEFVPPEVVIRYRNGVEVGPVDPRKRRWGPHKPCIGTSDWDIVGWRLP